MVIATRRPAKSSVPAPAALVVVPVAPVAPTPTPALVPVVEPWMCSKSPTGAHDWYIEHPHGEFSTGYCHHCDEKREFRNSAVFDAESRSSDASASFASRFLYRSMAGTLYDNLDLSLIKEYSEDRLRGNGHNHRRGEGDY